MVFTQLVQIAVLPILARLYGVADFGRFGMMVSAVVILGTVLALRYDVGIFAGRSPLRTANLAALATTVTLAVALLAGLGVAALPLPRMAGLDRAFVLAVLAAAALYCLWQVASNLAVREHRFAALFRSRVAQSAGSVTLWLVLPGLGLTAIGLPIGYGVGILLAVCMLGLPVRALVRAWRRPRLLRAVACRYRDFPRFGAPSALLNVLGQMQGAALLIGLAYGAEDAGLFFMAMRAIGTPVQVLAGAVAQVYAGRIAAAAATAESRWRLFLTISAAMCLLALLLLVPLVAFGGPLFELVLGAPWQSAGPMAVWLAIAFAGQLVASPVAHTLYVLEQQRAFMLWDASRTLAVVGAIVACRSLQLPVEMAVAALAVLQAATYALLWALVCRILRLDLSALPPHGRR